MLRGLEIAPGQAHEAGRKLLGEMYRDVTGEEMPPIVVDNRGKPRFASGKFHFSITHTPRHVFVALSERPVGLDAEELSRPVNLKLAEKILSGDEYRQYAAAGDKTKALLTFWVLKEAQGKLTGEGVRPWPNHTHFSLDDPRVFTQDGCLLALVE